eukprot:gb/GFBE01066400.1/.p1 GENE.gb/GFBE01066400.1/~~gb/GFBE01066400.1/.p1  ORF type:complete len:217 (+),score=19.83 gb/GFBE01066400.1/:1-651(+)
MSMALRLPSGAPLLPAAALYRFRQGGPATRSPQSSPADRRSPVQPRQPPLLPAAALYRPRRSMASLVVPGKQSPGGDSHALCDPTPRVPKKTLQLRSPTGPMQASPCNVNNSRNSPTPSPGDGVYLQEKRQRRITLTPSPTGPVFTLLSTPSSSCRRPVRRRVRFTTEVHSEYDITPYEDFYGTHPSHFDFDAEGNMITYSPGRWSPKALQDEFDD